MGTSTSSKGPGPGVPMVPPWADSPSGDGDNDGAGPDVQTNPPNNPPPQTQPSNPPPIAPNGRFAGARTNVGSFARSGDSRDLSRGLKSYVSRGYGGSATAARRMAGTAKVASSLSSVLSVGTPSTHSNVQPGGTQQANVNSADEVISSIVDAVAPIDGSQDSEVSRESVREVLAELVQEKPETDLLNLGDLARESIVEKFLAADVYRRIVLDIGEKIQDASPSAKAGLQRLRQVKEYVRETVKGAFNAIEGKSSPSSSSDMSRISSETLKATFEVFESYVK